MSYDQQELIGIACMCIGCFIFGIVVGMAAITLLF